MVKNFIVKKYFQRDFRKNFDRVKLAQLIGGKQGVLSCFARVFPLTDRFQHCILNVDNDSVSIRSYRMIPLALHPGKTRVSGGYPSPLKYSG
jgi:hypothetical protein